MTRAHHPSLDQVVVVTGGNGIAVIPQPTPLTRLHYFDGKFLRAEHLAAEQRYLRELVRLANLAGGAGVVHGLEARLEGDQLVISSGLAISPEGDTLLLPSTETRLDLTELIRRSLRRPEEASKRRPASPAFADCPPERHVEEAELVRGAELFVITISHAEALCGEEDVYGKACEEACVTSTDRPFHMEGLLVRAVRVTLPLPGCGGLPITSRHLRSRFASAWFRAEDERLASLISRAGIESDGWCAGAELGVLGPGIGPREVPIAVVAREGNRTRFLDTWIARRERMTVPSRRFWAERMDLRTWEAFLAQVLQFQCQLSEVLGGTRGAAARVEAHDPRYQVLADTTRFLADLRGQLTGVKLQPHLIRVLGDQGDKLFSLEHQLKQALVQAREHVLIEGGILSLPPAGWLPVVPGVEMTVNAQVRKLLGDCVDLRFCVVRPDYIPHALEEAQHMERISLCCGEAKGCHGEKDEVDILVPCGEIIETEAAGHLHPYRQRLVVDVGDGCKLEVDGMGRGEVKATGGAAFHFAGIRKSRRWLDPFLPITPQPKIPVPPRHPPFEPMIPYQPRQPPPPVTPPPVTPPPVTVTPPPPPVTPPPVMPPPVTVTPPPVIVTPPPVIVTPPPVTVTPPPVEVTPPPVTVTPPPIEITPGVIVTPPPVEVTPPPVTVTPPPVTMTPPPVTVTIPAVEVTPPPVTVTPPPVAVTPQPVDVTPRPVDDTTPVTAPPPVFVTPSPVTVTPPPVLVTPPPVTVTPPPVVVTSPPVEVTPPPVMVTPPPIEVSPGVTVPVPPIEVRPPPVSVIPDPVEVAPPPVTVTPPPVVVTPPPVTVIAPPVEIQPRPIDLVPITPITLEPRPIDVAPTTPITLEPRPIDVAPTTPITIEPRPIDVAPTTPITVAPLPTEPREVEPLPEPGALEPGLSIPIDPRLTQPVGAGHAALWLRPACAPCFLSRCPIDHRCLAALTVDEVTTAVRERLRTAGR